MAAKPRETYDIAETAAKCGAALDKLRAEQRPGAKSGRGGKAAVLRAVRDRLQSLSGEDYTTGQVTDALRAVIPSMSVRAVRAALREAAREGTEGKKGRQRKSARGTRAGIAESSDSRPTGSGAEREKTDKRPAAARSDAPASAAPPAHPRLSSVPGGGASAAPALDAAPPTAGTVAVPFTAEQRAQYRIPEWADGSDLRPGESLEKYAVRKRVAGPPKGEDELQKFIGEGRRRDP